jgi:hypothetical protein
MKRYTWPQGTSIGLAVIVLAVLFTLAGCPTDSGGDDPALAGAITISPTSAKVGQILLAAYSGSETVTFQWKKGDSNVGVPTKGTTTEGGSFTTYTPTEAGGYTVTVSAAGYQSKTSAAVIVTQGMVLSGTIAINPETAVTGMELTAAYTGAETVTYQWKMDGVINVGTDSNKYTPTEAGGYTVTVSAAGYQSKTSAAVTVSSPPSAPTVTASVVLGNIYVSWRLVPTATSYDVYYATDSSSTDKTFLATITGLGSYLHTECQYGTQYYYYVVAKNDAGSSDYGISNAVTFLFLRAPSITSASKVGHSGVSVSWASVTGATSYNVYYQLGNTSQDIHFIRNVTETSCTFEAGFTGYVYVYIRARDGVRISDYSKPVRVGGSGGIISL